MVKKCFWQKNIKYGRANRHWLGNLIPTSPPTEKNSELWKSRRCWGSARSPANARGRSDLISQWKGLEFWRNLRTSQASGSKSGLLSSYHTMGPGLEVGPISSHEWDQGGAGGGHITPMALFLSYFGPRPACKLSLIYFMRSLITSNSSQNTLVLSSRLNYWVK